MKKSEELRIEAATEESDFASLKLHAKAYREERKEEFEDKWLQLLLEKVSVTLDVTSGKYTMKHKRVGTIDFFPKANRVLVRYENRWINRGLQWLIKHFELK